MILAYIFVGVVAVVFIAILIVLWLLGRILGEIDKNTINYGTEEEQNELKNKGK